MRTPAFRPLLAALLLAAACRPSTPLSAPAPAFAKRAEGSHGMVAASHPDAAAAGAAILRAGGNAIDAAVATAFALSVVDPSQTGLGGGGGMVVWRHDARATDAIDFYARTGADSGWAVVDSAASRRPINGRAAGIPGAVAGLLGAHERWGRLPRAQVMAPAIALARDGFVVSPLLARTAASSRAKLAADSAAAGRFLPGGRALRPGERLVQPELASTLEAIAAGGAPAFYEGPIAARTVAAMRDRGSVATVDDFRDYRVTPKRPLCTTWRGYTMVAAPPGQGGAAPLAALALLDASGGAALGSPTTSGRAAVRLLAAMRVADADVSRWRGDPAIYGVPAHGITSTAYTARRATLLDSVRAGTPVPAGDPWADDAVPPAGACAQLDGLGASALGRDRATPPRPARPADDAEVAPNAARPVPEEGEAASNTSHLSVVDADRNAVALTFTVGVLFGSGVYANGFFLNSGANNFDATTRGTNRFGSSTIAPTIVLDGDAVRWVAGAAGSAYIPTATTQVTWRHLALGEDPWLAIAAPRLHPGRGATVEVEPGFAPEVYAALAAAGYEPLSRVADITFGGVHAIAVHRGRLIGVADPRRDGAAVGY
ncbi:MAG: gamma-glutamyltransferase family protein [Gemmatimonadaceae bacterium]